MSQPQLPAQEAARLDALYQYEILDTPPEAVFDDIVRLAAQISDTPIASINFIDRDRQWFKANTGWMFGELPRHVGFCSHAILQAELLIVPDTCQDIRFADNSLVSSEPYIRFYAGVPLIIAGGQAIGTLCVMARQPRTFNRQQAHALSMLARQVVNHLESRRQLIYSARVIAECRKTKAVLQQSEANLKAIFNSRLQAVVLIDRNHKIRAFNRTAEEWVEIIFGRKIKEDACIYEFVNQEHLDDFNRALKTAFEGELVRVEKLFKGIDCTKHWFEIEYSPVFDDSGTVTGVCYVIINIDRRKTAVEALTKSEERFRSLVQNSSDTITVLEADGTIRYISPSVERILGYKAADLVGLNAIAYVHPEDVPAYQASLAKKLQQPGVVVFSSFRVRHADGAWIYMETLSNNQLDNASVKGLVLNSRDITERKQAEQQIQASLKEKEVLLKEIHHRVKNNLQIISSLLNLQSGYIKDRQALESFKESQSRIKSIALLHEKLYQSKDLSQINFAEYVQQLASNLFRAYGVNSSAISFKIHAEDILMGVDTAIPCGLIINELVSNCIKHAFPAGNSGEICILLRRVPNQDNKLILTVRDNGVGFPKHINFRNPESLGLQLVNTLAAQLKGNVELSYNDITEFNISFLEHNN